MTRVFLVFIFLIPICLRAGVIDSILISGNEKTKAQIIQRELTFEVGDTISEKYFPKYIGSSYNNLVNTQLFNYVHVTLDEDSNEHITATIKVEERWYFWPELVFEFQERNFTEWLRNRDFDRLDYGMFLMQRNVRGLDETLQVLLQWGFNKKVGCFYKWPNLTKRQKNGLNVGGFYNSQNEAFIGVDERDKMVYQTTSGPLVVQNRVFIEYSRRSKFYLRHYLKLGFNHYDVNSEMQDINPHYLSNKESRIVKYFDLSFMAKFDKRDSRNYPLKGHYIDFQFYQNGLALFENGLSVSSIKFNARHFIQLANRWHFSYGGYSNIFFQDEVPFLFQGGLGFQQYVRGYEPFVIMGKQNYLAKSNLKFTILKPWIKEFDWIPVEKFKKYNLAIYTNAFFDMGHSIGFLSREQSLNGKLLWGAGLGVDFVTYYDLVWRFELAQNDRGLMGGYISFVAPL